MPGGLVLAAEQIAPALRRHSGTVTVFVPRYAMSGGTLIALAADEIVMDPNAVLGPSGRGGRGAPREVYDLVELFPQSNQRRPGVEFIPLPYAPRTPVAPTKTDRR